MHITTIGIDLAKSVFQLHGVDAEGKVVLKKKLRRGAVLNFLRDLSPCLIGMEACATSHHWAREIGALGHEVRLIPPAYVKALSRCQTAGADISRGPSLSSGSGSGLPLAHGSAAELA